ncbi:DNA primase [Sphingomonas sp. MAH-20]|uniref:DNA primase n=1 Tax=Sphingomonas horti TaxID=2682842 RepID=A0A6I4IWA6_9SPHN|nr:DNA primase [Sphingomonas sp. CGMCC 1.13658]MBA2920104.1 DNA primase [Sphingomonas sp. CGMCC 1.13658]MVO76359.1 DNA primase [Sphingomonas horti]
MSLSPAFLDELRTRTLLSALVAKTVKLQRKGREFAACCPFHNEKTPSFYVNDEKGFYHCFGCGAHGDAIRWMTDQRGLPFIDAVKELAQAAGMELPAPDAREAARAERARSLHDVMAAAAAWFEEQYNGLPGAAARAYVERRGITDATRKAFALGYAPDSKTGLRRALAKFGDAMLVEAGLLIEVEGKEPYDRFRDRLMIPIRDPRGRVIAFGGRIIGQGEPKYLNSPDTPLFDKGRTLYNLDCAAPAARKSGRMIVVEGYLDVIALAQAGIEEAVAPLGTALTEFQIERLWRQVDAPLLCFDGDAAGQKAAFRAAIRALPGLAPGRSLSFLTLPSGQDPDDLVRSGGARAFESLAAAPEPLVDRLWNHELAEPLATPEQRAGLRKRLNELAAAIADPDVRQQYQAEFRERFDTRFLQRPAFQRGPRPPFRPGTGWQPPRPISPEAKGVGSAGIDRRLLKGVVAGLLRYPDLLARHAEALHGLQASDPAIARLLDALVDLALEEQALDTERLGTILRSSEFDALARDLLRADRLRFSFTKKDADPERARTDLAEVIQAMVEQPEIEAALRSATERFMRTMDDNDRLEQQRLRELRDENARRLANLMQDDEGA